MNPIIDVQNLSKVYNRTTVLDNISFQIAPGETVALLGENGAGKSTLINLLNQLIQPNSGTTYVMGTQDIRKVRDKVGVMLQQNLSLERVTVKECLNLARSYYHNPLSYEVLIRLANLKEKEKCYLDQLSGGQKRRLTFATTMAGNPQLIFLDEPTAGMDSNSRQSFWESIDRLKQNGKTFFITNHYLEELDQIADRILILKDTRLVYDGTLKSLRKKSGHITIQFTTPLPKETFTSISAVKECLKTNQHLQLITDEPNVVMEALIPYLNKLDELAIQQNSLASLFQKVIGGSGK